MWHVEHTTLDLLQQLPQVVIIKRQSPLWVGKTALIMSSGIRGGKVVGREKWNKKVRRVGLTTNRANRITPQLHTSALRPSYFSPCGRRAMPDVSSVQGRGT